MNGANVLTRFTADTKDLDKKAGEAKNTLSKIGKGVASAFKVATVAATATTAAIGVLVKKSVDAYAEFEQLEGGLVSLFGEGSKEMQQILGLSEEAYKNLTMSQNEYLNSFEKAYPLVNAGLSENADSIEYTNKMLQISSDLFNTYGGSVEQYQNAINWALKGSFVYLDNLNLGIKGTQEGFIEAANASGVLNRNIKSVNELTSDEIIDVIEHYADAYGVLGKTADEASGTIIGSLNMTKASWNNLLAGFSKDGADINKLIDELITSASAFGTNMLPVIQRALEGIMSALPGIIQKIGDMLPDLLSTLLPILTNVLITLIKTFVNILPTTLPILMDAVVDVIKGLAAILPDIINALLAGLILIIQTLAEMTPEILPIIVDAILGIIPILIDNLPLFINAGFKLIGGLLAGIINSIPSLLGRIGQIVVSMINAFKKINLKDIGKNLLTGLWNGIKSMKDWVINKVKELGKSILKGLKGVLGIHSPSTEFAMVGKFSVLGYTEQLDKMQKEVQGQIAETFQVSPQLANSSSLHYSPNVNVINNVDITQDPLGQMVNNIKTFAGGAKNDYNYGAGF